MGESSFRAGVRIGQDGGRGGGGVGGVDEVRGVRNAQCGIRIQKVQAHFCGWTMSRAIRYQTSPDFATNFRETPNFRGGARG